MSPQVLQLLNQMIFWLIFLPALVAVIAIALEPCTCETYGYCARCSREHTS